MDRSIGADMYEHHKQTGCDDVAAAVLALAEVAHRLPGELSSTMATGLSAFSGLAAGLAGDGEALRAERHVNGDASPRRQHVCESIATNQRESTPSPKKATAHQKGQRAARGRGDRNHADLQVLESFLPSDETKRLAEFFDSVGMPIIAKIEMQQLLTLIF